MDVTPSEQEAINKVVAAQMARYRGAESISFGPPQLRDALITELAAAGWVAQVSTDIMDPDNYDLLPGGRLVYTPRVNIIARTSGEGLDHERMSFEVKQRLGYVTDPWTGERKSL